MFNKEDFYKIHIKKLSVTGFVCTNCGEFCESTDKFKTKTNWCKDCYNFYNLCNRLKNKEDIRQKKKIYYQKTSSERKLKRKEYYNTIKGKNSSKRSNEKYVKSGKYNKYINNRIKNDPIFKLRRTVRSRIYHCLKFKGFYKKNTTANYLGCSIKELKTHLESQFKPGMTWDNHGIDGWHIDHIIPLNSENTVDEINKLCHYTNLQPLWAKDNLKKSDKI